MKVCCHSWLLFRFRHVKIFFRISVTAALSAILCTHSNLHLGQLLQMCCGNECQSAFCCFLLQVKLLKKVAGFMVRPMLKAISSQYILYLHQWHLGSEANIICVKKQLKWHLCSSNYISEPKKYSNIKLDKHVSLLFLTE